MQIIILSHKQSRLQFKSSLSLLLSFIIVKSAVQTLDAPRHTDAHRRRRRWPVQGAGPLKSGKIFFGQLLCKILAFFGQNHAKFGNFVNFSGKYSKKKIGYFDNFMGKKHVKFGHFADF